ncbi:hypothetical protein ASPVEDRAFT_82924 [Aspergillus versicolor CBS 583.65]|uniref:Mid2 domain-containing protein n=1 Tax=Aspergillus versicolor CBS 583.65 TaxID=1036611 RepID=A0A1L9PIR2_ASPVE|nr:uncharacterized protein ASPVEDRAFT_82924 [Aspergillus versicolor CBS 583.65]OJJ01398.1 hypothetical protein ASPVEDRAFT_82924 [Aspergillus versicolor CBS 583.65]
MRRLFLAVLGASHLLAASADDVTCYKLDGTSRTVDGTKVCNSLDGAVSMCCASSDTCLNNGLCKTAGDSVSYWRDMCSISSWPEVGCLKICTSDAVVDESGNALMTPCDGTDYSETWCCGPTTDCCGNSDEITLPADIYASSSTPTPTPTSETSTSESRTSTSATTSSDSTATPSSEQSPASSESSGLSSGSKAGIGVGVAAGVIIGLGFFAFFLIQRRRKRAAIAPGATFDGSARRGAAPGAPQELEQSAVYETPADKQNTRYELPTQQSTVADR